MSVKMVEEMVETTASEAVRIQREENEALMGLVKARILAIKAKKEAAQKAAEEEAARKAAETKRKAEEEAAWAARKGEEETKEAARKAAEEAWRKKEAAKDEAAQKAAAKAEFWRAVQHAKEMGWKCEVGGCDRFHLREEQRYCSFHFKEKKASGELKREVPEARKCPNPDGQETCLGERYVFDFGGEKEKVADLCVVCHKFKKEHTPYLDTSGAYDPQKRKEVQGRKAEKSLRDKEIRGKMQSKRGQKGNKKQK